PVQGGIEGGVGDVLDVARVGGGEGEGGLFRVGEVAGELDLVGIVAGRGRRIVARAAAVGGLGPASVRGHHRGAGTVLPVVAGGEADNSPGRPGQQGEAEHGDDDDASNGGGHGGLSSSSVHVDVAVAMQAGGDELDVPELFVVDVHAVLQPQCADLLPAFELRPGAGVGAGGRRRGGRAAV